MKKSNLALLLGALFILQAAVIGANTVAAQEQDSFIYGVGSGVADLDPQFLWDSASADVAEQVCEGLFVNELSEEMTLLPHLADGEGLWDNDTSFTVSLKEGVTFHDGTAFNASAVQWSFERLNGFILNGETQTAEMFGKFVSDDAEAEGFAPGTYINNATGDEDALDFVFMINRTQIMGEFSIRFHLNYIYPPFKALLAFDSAFILSPTSTPKDRLLELGTDTLVGTGPYKYDSYSEEQVVFKAFEDYHLGAPALKTLIFLIIEDQVTRNQALLDGDIDMVDAIEPSFLAELQDAEHVTVSDGPNRVIIQYLGMSSHVFDKEWRKAISYAVDYDYLLDEILQDMTDRLSGPIPQGIAYYNDSFDTPTLDLAIARQTLLDAGYATGLAVDDDEAWVAKAESATPVKTINYTYNVENSVRKDIGTALVSDLKQIGIKVESFGVNWRGDGGMVRKLYFAHQELQMYQGGWIPDINDPSNYFNQLLHSGSLGNSDDHDIPELDQVMDDALNTTVPAERKALYDRAQEICIEEEYVWAFGWVGKGLDAWNAGLVGYPQNPLAKVWFQPCTYDKVAPPRIPGYSLMFLGMAAIGTVAAILRKRK